jgi:uncharacterized YccA/Bax inhibitor family protein
VRESSNPVFRSLPKGQGGYAQFGTGAAGYGAQQVDADPYVAQYPDQQQTGVSRPLTIDDVVTKTGITLAVLSAVAVVSYFLVSGNVGLAMPFTLVGAFGGLALVLVATFGRKQDNPAIVLSYAALEGLFLGAFSFVIANLYVSGTSAGALISQAILGTIGVFIGMLVVYKTGAVRVTPRFTKWLLGAMVGVIVLLLFNLVMSLFGINTGLRDGGPVAIIFSLLIIGVAAFSLLLDFDQADKAIRGGAPATLAWYIAFGLMTTLVWLYIEILNLLSYLRN